MSLIRFTRHTLERFVKNIKDRIQDVTPFVGTQSEWNALSASEKAKYKIVHLLGSGTYKRDATTGELVSIAGSGGSTQTMTGATASTDGVGGSTPTPLAGEQGKFLKGNAEWSTPNLASDITGTLAAANGGTGNTSLQATRNAMGLGNTTGALPVANGGTGATTSAAARQNLFNEDLSSAVQYIIGITGSWAKGGYLTLQQLRNKMGLGNTTGALPIANGGTGATTAAGALTNLNISPIEISTSTYFSSISSGISFDQSHTKIIYYPGLKLIIVMIRLAKKSYNAGWITVGAVRSTYLPRINLDGFCSEWSGYMRWAVIDGGYLKVNASSTGENELRANFVYVTS